MTPHWQMMQVQMIKNTIWARSFSVHRLILTGVLLSRRGRNGGGDQRIKSDKVFKI